MTIYSTMNREEIPDAHWCDSVGHMRPNIIFGNASNVSRADVQYKSRQLLDDDCTAWSDEGILGSGKTTINECLGHGRL